MHGLRESPRMILLMKSKSVRYLWYLGGLTASQFILDHSTDGGVMVGSQGTQLMHYQLRSVI